MPTEFATCVLSLPETHTNKHLHGGGGGGGVPIKTQY